ncbi:MAG: polysaccharide deacetylase family protein [Lunatimonas sp.]|uniref:polysaccharide deacetylase family protein n=1 Tax=Lunatimonas sp. TaxID=2060141 RepID=UPI00263B9ECD|nr:polysaccharide deacetylase family protein [Lunatimonas sp.]MCC5936237.1 polysaccharide deacetylase family protein [Lunatimonas sp.]
MRKSFFVISLDFELHWGRFDKVSARGQELYYARAREAVPRLLDLFSEFDLSVTWATVGMLLAENREEWRTYHPSIQPLFNSETYSAYRWYERNTTPDSLLFAPDLAKRIASYPKQEIGCHTHSHFYTREAGACNESFRADLQAAKCIVTEKLGLKMRSLVFPRNQYSPETIRIAGEEGFDFLRTNPEDWYWRDPHDNQLAKRLFRTGDSMVPLGRKTSYPLDKMRFDSGPLKVPASRFFRPFQPKVPWINHMKLQRIMQEMSLAAHLGEVYHLWWHPHNHGHYLEETLVEVRKVLNHYLQLHEQYGMESMSMNGFGALV